MDATGTVTALGARHVTSFESFQQLPGWRDLPGLKEDGWQGPPGPSSFSGIPRVAAHLENLGDGVLEAWCLMPGVSMPGDHQSDGIALTGGGFDFVDYRDNERRPHGVMFYSTDPTVEGYVQTEDGTTTYRAGTPH